jgi:hypothetical protein
VPHSQCSLRENPKFFQNFRSKNNTLKEKFWLIFLFNICHCNSGLAFKGKKLIHCWTKLYVLHKRKFPKVTSATQVSFVNEAPGLNHSCWLVSLLTPTPYCKSVGSLKLGYFVMSWVWQHFNTTQKRWRHISHLQSLQNFLVLSKWEFYSKLVEEIK